MNVMIAGASGLVGGELLKLLIHDKQIKNIISLGRRTLKTKDPRLQQIIVDWENASKLHLAQCEIGFCCLGTTIKKAGSKEAFRKVDHDYIIEFAKLAKSHGARIFATVTALGANPNSKIFYNRIKGETENDLKAIGFESLIIFRPSLLLGERTEARAIESIATKLEPFYRPFLIGPLAKQRPIQAKKVAQSLLIQSKKATSGTKIISNEAMLEE